MKRDLNLIAKILRFVESEGIPGEILLPPSIEGYDPMMIEYHLGLCREAKFLRFKPAMKGMVNTSKIVALTWRGHDFLDAFRAEKH